MLTTQHPIIQVRDATKYFDGAVGIQGVSFDVYPGEVFGVVGANGSGKTTLLQAMAGRLALNTGCISIHGRDVRAVHRAIRSHLGEMPSGLVPDGRHTVREHLEEVAAMHQVSLMPRALALCDQLWLHPDAFVAHLSPAGAQKLAIVQAFAHMPDVLLLDEPTKWLELAAQHELEQMIDEAKQRGATVVTSCAALATMKPMADRVAILRHGQLVGIGGKVG